MDFWESAKIKSKQDGRDLKRVPTIRHKHEIQWLKRNSTTLTM